MGSHKYFSPLGYGIAKCGTKQSDDIIIILFTIDLNGLAKHMYMSI
jgi:hypothetical protein